MFFRGPRSICSKNRLFRERLHLRFSKFVGVPKDQILKKIRNSGSIPTPFLFTASYIWDYRDFLRATCHHIPVPFECRIIVLLMLNQSQKFFIVLHFFTFNNTDLPKPSFQKPLRTWWSQVYYTLLTIQMDRFWQVFFQFKIDNFVLWALLQKLHDLHQAVQINYCWSVLLEKSFF